MVDLRMNTMGVKFNQEAQGQARGRLLGVSVLQRQLGIGWRGDRLEETQAHTASEHRCTHLPRMALTFISLSPSTLNCFLDPGQQSYSEGLLGNKARWQQCGAMNLESAAPILVMYMTGSFTCASISASLKSHCHEEVRLSLLQRLLLLHWPWLLHAGFSLWRVEATLEVVVPGLLAAVAAVVVEH